MTTTQRMLRGARCYQVVLVCSLLLNGICILYSNLQEERRRAEVSIYNNENAEVERPIMHTFYDPDPKGYCCGMLEVRSKQHEI